MSDLGGKFSKMTAAETKMRNQPLRTAPLTADFGTLAHEVFPARAADFSPMTPDERQAAYNMSTEVDTPEEAQELLRIQNGYLRNQNSGLPAPSSDLAKGAGFPMTPPNPAVSAGAVRPGAQPSFLDVLRQILMPKKPAAPPTSGLLGDRG